MASYAYLARKPTVACPAESQNFVNTFPRTDLIYAYASEACVSTMKTIALVPEIVQSPPMTGMGVIGLVTLADERFMLIVFVFIYPRSNFIGTVRSLRQ